MIILKKLQVPFQEINVFTGFIDFIVGQLQQYLMCQNINLFFTNEFKSFYYIKENVKADMQYFSNLILEEDSMGFIPVKRNIRISSEAILDLYNMVNVENYITVLQYMEDRYNDKYSEEFKEYCYKGDFTLISKLNIAKANNFGDRLDFLKDGFLKHSNKYIHASIFIQPNNLDFILKLNDAKRLLLIEIDLYKKAVECLCEKYKFNFSGYVYQCPPQNIYQNRNGLTFEQVHFWCINQINNMTIFDIYPQNQNIFM